MDSIDRRQFLAAVPLGVVGLTYSAHSLGQGREVSSSLPKTRAPWDREIGMILQRLRPPVFPQRIVRLTDIGGRDDGTADSRPAMQRGIDQLNAQGGGQLLVPPGIWRVNGPVRLKSNIELHLEDGATMQFGSDPDLYLPVVLTRCEGTELYNYSPLIYSYQAENVAVTGKGTISGNGAEVFASWREKAAADRELLRRMGSEGVPVHQRVFGRGHFLPPSLMQFFGCRNVLVDGIGIVDQPFWGIHPVYSQNVIVRGVQIDSPRIFNDGVDPESSSDVLIENCVFKTGDDCVAIKSGRDQDGWRVGRPSENIVVRNCEMNGHSMFVGGIAIGSEMSGGVRNVYIENCRMGAITWALNFKANLDRGGVVEHVRVSDVSVDNATKLVQFTSAFAGYQGGHFPPTFRDFDLRRISCRNAGVAISAVGVPDAPLQKITIRDMTVQAATTPVDIHYVRNFRMDEVRINRKAVASQANVD